MVTIWHPSWIGLDMSHIVQKRPVWEAVLDVTCMCRCALCQQDGISLQSSAPHLCHWASSSRHAESCFDIGKLKSRCDNEFTVSSTSLGNNCCGPVCCMGCLRFIFIPDLIYLAVCFLGSLCWEQSALLKAATSLPPRTVPRWTAVQVIMWCTIFPQSTALVNVPSRCLIMTLLYLLSLTKNRRVSCPGLSQLHAGLWVH